jgi:hypothetical protein
MKRRRSAVAICMDCEKSFESQESSARHFNSRNHIQRLLAIKNAPMMSGREVTEQVEQDSEIMTEDEDDEQWFFDDTSSSDDESSISDNTRDVFFNAEQEQFLAMDENADGDFSPFPSEKFFLLYCYAHSVMRPKVRTA